MPLANTAPVAPRERLPEPEAEKAHGRPGRIKVVFVIDNMRLGGTELNAVRTAERLDRDWFELRVVCLGGDGPLTERYRASGVIVENMPIHSFHGPSMVRSGRRFATMLQRERIDIVHAHDVYSNIFAAVWGTSAPVLITSRRWWSSLPNWKLKVGSWFALSRSTAILANSRAVAEAVTGRSAAAKGRVWTVTNFVDEAAFGTPDEQERQRLRQQWKAPADAVVIGCVARFDPVKDHAALLRAFSFVHAGEPNVYLVLTGDGPTRSAAESLAAELGLQDRVHFAGEQQAGSNLHRGFDISVLSSRSEGFPNSLVEAMAAGNPVVATAVGGSADAVLSGETGLLVPPGQPYEMASALLRLVENADLRAAFGRAGERRAREAFHSSRVVPALEDMYRQVLTQSKP